MCAGNGAAPVLRVDSRIHSNTSTPPAPATRGPGARFAPSCHRCLALRKTDASLSEVAAGGTSPAERRVSSARGRSSGTSCPPDARIRVERLRCMRRSNTPARCRTWCRSPRRCRTSCRRTPCDPSRTVRLRQPVSQRPGLPHFLVEHERRGRAATGGGRIINQMPAGPWGVAFPPGAMLRLLGLAVGLRASAASAASTASRLGFDSSARQRDSRWARRLLRGYGLDPLVLRQPVRAVRVNIDKLLLSRDVGEG